MEVSRSSTGVLSRPLSIAGVMKTDRGGCRIKKGKASSLDIAPLTILNNGALQPRKWQLTGNDCSTAAHAVVAQSLRYQAIGPTVAASRHTPEERVCVLGEGSKPSPHQLGSLGIAVISPSGVRGGFQTPKGFPLFSTLRTASPDTCGKKT